MTTTSRRATRKGASINSGTLSPNPWDLALSRQNGCSKLKTLERRIGLRRDATRAPIQGPEWQRDGVDADSVLNTKSDPTDISKSKTKNGLDNGVHIIRSKIHHVEECFLVGYLENSHSVGTLRSDVGYRCW